MIKGTTAEIDAIKNQLDLETGFKLLKKISQFCDSKERVNLLYRLMEKRNYLPNSVTPILNDLLMQSGCNQYVKEVNDSWAALELAIHQSDHISDIFFHRDQLFALKVLNKNKQLVLSAPTSFGKSLLIEELVASKIYSNIVIIQPTLALLDESRKKLRKYSDTYKVIYSIQQRVEEKNIFLLTPERFIEFEKIPAIDFFVIDEFYKLSDDDPERSSALNQAFYRLLKITSNFYLLGPLIDSIPKEFLRRYPKSFLQSNFETVTLNHKDQISRKFEVLEELLKNETEPCLIYCKGPSSCENLAKDFAESITDAEYADHHQDIKDWVKKFIHNDWLLMECLPKGVGFHHGVMPRHVGKYLVEAFNERKIKYLFCTSTLMEGVNTSAKNVYVWDLKKGKTDNLTSFDFRNISGRAGRLGKYYVGNVYTFGKPPAKTNQDVDFWWLTQIKAPDELLIQIDEKDLLDDSRKRIDQIKATTRVDIEILKTNSNVSILGQNSLKEFLSKNPDSLKRLSDWTVFPTYEQLLEACNLIWAHLILAPRNKTKDFIDEVASGPQLALFTWKYYQSRSLKTLIEEFAANGINKLKPEHKQDSDKIKKVVTKSIRDSMKISRRWFEFRLPKLLVSLSRICSDVDPQFGGDFTVFATALENSFLQASLSSLREIGIPIEVATKIDKFLSSAAKDDLELAVNEIRKIIDRNPAGFEKYELYLLKDVF